MKKRRVSTIAALVAVTAVAANWGVVPALAAETPVPAAAAVPVQTQAVFASPEAAAKALHDAVESGDLKAMDHVLGPASSKLIYTGDDVADQQMHERFLDSYAEALRIERVSDGKAVLLVGKNESEFPYPLLQNARGWQFDATAGADEIINRRIGQNELFAMKFCLAYGDAQREYGEVDRDGDGLIEYAQKFRSSAGKHDGLFWKTKDGEPESPLGPLVADAVAEGYAAKDTQPIPYHGYYYRILTAQGPHAPGGAYDYMVNGNMIGGYALVAYPARWGASGVMTFTCSHDGLVYEKNLDEATAEIASKMKLFDPDASWQKAQ
ncbi:MAG: DUF2950 domain-containing protein [Spongiibacteraceae bacterium]